METLYSWPLWKPSWLTKDLSTQSLRKKDSNGSTALPRLTRISLTNYRIRRLRLSCLLLVQESRHPSPRIIRTLAWAMVDEGFVYPVSPKERLEWVDGSPKIDKDQSNQLPDPTSPSVMPPAGAGVAPSVAADH